jgi:hypothetical protein
MNEEHPSSKDNVDMDAIVGQANQLANTILLALRTVHEYIVPRALSHEIKLSARDQHAWAMNLTIALSQAKAHRRMPATRLQKPTARRRAPVESDDSQAPRKSELFPRAEPPASDPMPFSNPAISPALRKLRQMLSNDHVEEEELRETFVRWYLGMQTEQETEIERRPRSPVLKCSPIRAGAGAAAPPELSALQPRGRRSAARTRKQ